MDRQFYQVLQKFHKVTVGKCHVACGRWTQVRLRSIDLACVGYSFVSYSLGEYAALVIAGVFALDVGLRRLVPYRVRLTIEHLVKRPILYACGLTRRRSSKKQQLRLNMMSATDPRSPTATVPKMLSLAVTACLARSLSVIRRGSIATSG